MDAEVDAEVDAVWHGVQCIALCRMWRLCCWMPALRSSLSSVMHQFSKVNNLAV